jgi:hypothetical protein
LSDLISLSRQNLEAHCGIHDAAQLTKRGLDIPVDDLLHLSRNECRMERRIGPFGVKVVLLQVVNQPTNVRQTPASRRSAFFMTPSATLMLNILCERR